jgi:hypothetical protein
MGEDIVLQESLVLSVEECWVLVPENLCDVENYWILNYVVTSAISCLNIGMRLYCIQVFKELKLLLLLLLSTYEELISEAMTCTSVFKTACLRV